MATIWNIGIDETGSFWYFDFKGQRSSVCAAISKFSHDELLAKFSEVFAQRNGHGSDDKNEILRYFHVRERSDEDNKAIFDSLSGLVHGVVASKGRPIVLGNPQHWWLSCVMTVVRSVMESPEVVSGDTLNIHLGTRIIGVVGTPEEVDWFSYHKQLEQDLMRWVRNVDTKNLNVNLICRSAVSSALVTLADQTIGMMWNDCDAYLAGKIRRVDCYDFGTSEFGESHAEATTLGEKCTGILESGDVAGALRLWLRAFFARESIPSDLFAKVMSRAQNSEEYVDVLRQALDSCEYALDNRGLHPELVDRAIKLAPQINAQLLWIESLDAADRVRYGVDAQLMMDIWRILAKVSTHRGSLNCEALDSVDRYWEGGGAEFVTTMDRWKHYLQAKLISAQIPFNGYDFKSVSACMAPLLEIQEKMNALPFPCASVPLVDDDYAALLGTMGQAAAFMGDLDLALEYFERDYAAASPSWKPMPAGFAVAVLHRKRDFEGACAWFERQTGGVSLESFGVTISESTDLWQCLSYYKLAALALELGKPVNVAIPAIEEWAKPNAYPWSLVLKWVAYCLVLQGDTARASALLTAAAGKLKNGGYAVKTLALSVLQMLYAVNPGSEIETKYEALLQGLLNGSAHFKEYVESRQEQFKLSADTRLWDAAMLLPFNYS